MLKPTSGAHQTLCITRPSKSKCAMDSVRWGSKVSQSSQKSRLNGNYSWVMGMYDLVHYAIAVLLLSADSASGGSSHPAPPSPATRCLSLESTAWLCCSWHSHSTPQTRNPPLEARLSYGQSLLGTWHWAKIPDLFNRCDKYWLYI